MEKNSILFLGDTFLKAKNGENPFARIDGILDNTLICVNLETSLDDGSRKNKLVNLGIDNSALDFLDDRFLYINLVNNHSGDCSSSLFFSEKLESLGKIVIGPSNPSLKRISFNDIPIDFISCYFGLPITGTGYRKKLVEQLVCLLKGSDASRKIVMLHWGFEHLTIPAPFQRKIAYLLADAGANLIIGHHPHVVQGYETYNGCRIFYSLGNFNFWQFDRPTSDLNRYGLIVKYFPEDEDIYLMKVFINENFQPVQVDSVRKHTEHLEALSCMLPTISEREWFHKYYPYWYHSEIKSWQSNFSFSVNFKSRILLYVKFLLWMLLPLQIKFYYYHLSEKLIHFFDRKSII